MSRPNFLNNVGWIDGTGNTRMQLVISRSFLAFKKRWCPEQARVTFFRAHLMRNLPIYSVRLALYGVGKSPPIRQGTAIPPIQAEPVQHLGFHPDDTTPIPRPSRYYGRRQYAPLMDQLRKISADRKQASLAPLLLPDELDSIPDRIDKSQLPIAESKPLRDKAHLKFVASQPCLICGRQPSDPHHLRFAQPRAIGLKVSDEFTVPLCRGHHRQLHQPGNEAGWWE